MPVLNRKAFSSPPRPPHVLVLDGGERASLSVVRSLVRAGARVTATAGERWSLATVSRGVRGARVVRDPLEDPAGYAREIADIAGHVEADVVIPVTDASADAMLEHRLLLPSRVLLPFPSWEIYRAASDKVLVHALASEFGIGVPVCEIVRRHGDSAPEDSRLYPGVVKPHRSVVGRAPRRKTGVRFVADVNECRRVLAELGADAFPVLVQGRVVGPGEGVFIGRWAGRTIARFAHRRLREKPPAGGVSVFRESIELASDLLMACEKLLDRLQWQGVAMIEGKRDLATGRWHLMEINGRFWGSLQLAIDSGVDFPVLLLQALLGHPHEPPPSWRSGVRLRWEWGDVDHLLIRLRHSRKHLALSDDAPGRLAAAAAFLSIVPGHDRLEILRLSDPLPFLVESLGRIGLRR